MVNAQLKNTQMKVLRIHALACLLMGSLMACEDYNDFVVDNEFTAVYFASQRPLRTIVADDDMSFKVGVALAGKRSNDVEEFATFEIQPLLLQDPEVVGGRNFTLLPESYYTLSDNSIMTIPPGKFIGDVTVTLDIDAFTGDGLAVADTYALPLAIIETSADSVLSGQFDENGTEQIASKDYTVLVVKYISPLHGTYFHKGLEQELDIDGQVVSEEEYNNRDLIKNQTWSFTTLGLDSVTTSGVGTRTSSGTAIYSLKLLVNADNTVSVESVAGNKVTDIQGEGTYKPEESAFYLKYQYTNSGTRFNVIDTLIQRQPPEKDLRFEEWDK